MMNIKISQIEYYLPGDQVSNDDLQKENPDWDMGRLSEKSGVYNRHIAKQDETAFDLACKACEKLFSNREISIDTIDGIIFCTQSPDYIMPSNAFLLHKHLNLRQSVFAFDINLACSGFIYGLSIARGFISTALGKKILLVNSDTYSKYINPKDRSAKILFGDGAAASIITRNVSKGVIDIMLASSGKDFDSFYIPSGGCRLPKSKITSAEEIDAAGNTHSAENIHMNGFGVWKFIASTVPKQINEILNRNGYTVNDIDLYVFHQASKMTLDSLIKGSKIDPDKVFNNIRHVGNLVSASIPVALKDALTAGRLKKGDLVLLSGFGVGLSWGTIILRY
jgi:3-oxoacyl-[acyl-carrier-protein] synthase-3